VPRTDSAQRVVAATPERVFAAFVDPGALLQWLPPAGMSGRFEYADLRPGGAYRLVLTYSGAANTGKTTADSDVVSARIVEITPGARLVQAVDFDSLDPAFGGTMLMTWQVLAVPGGRLVQVRADDVPDGISAADHAAGFASSLANLAVYVEG
jgi:uncharacterized protein YndB with AHSA1/START domain